MVSAQDQTRKTDPKLADERRDLRGALSHRNHGLSDSEVRGNRQNRSRRKIQGSFLPFHRPLFVTNRMAGITGASGIPPLASARTSWTNR
jgi:hypothetical protein